MRRLGMSALVLSFFAIGCGSDEDIGKPADPGPGTNEPESCGLNTGWAGDEYCILPPPADKGFQVHYGPSNYDDRAEVEKYLIQPSLDTIIFASATSGNESDIFFYKRQYRMRRGSHHLIVSAGSGAGSILSMGRRLGGSQNTVKDNPIGEIPPENVGIGMPLSALSSLSLNLHHFNPTTEPLLKEAWVNFWYVEGPVTREAKEIFLWAQGTTVLPGSRITVLGKKAITEEGRILTLYGHRHSNNVRFSAFRVRDGNRELVYDDYDWEEPAVFEYNTLTDNPAPDPAKKAAGAFSGMLDLKVGDVLEWECEIFNGHNEPITFGENEGGTSEMCILVGDSIGPQVLTGIQDFS